MMTLTMSTLLIIKASMLKRILSKSILVQLQGHILNSMTFAGEWTRFYYKGSVWRNKKFLKLNKKLPLLHRLRINKRKFSLHPLCRSLTREQLAINSTQVTWKRVISKLLVIRVVKQLSTSRHSPKLQKHWTRTRISRPAAAQAWITKKPLHLKINNISQIVQ